MKRHSHPSRDRTEDHDDDDTADRAKKDAKSMARTKSEQRIKGVQEYTEDILAEMLAGFTQKGGQ